MMQRRQTLAAVGIVVVTLAAIQLPTLPAIADSGAEVFHTACSVDWSHPLPVAWLKKAGIEYVFIYAGQPIEWDAKTGRPSLRPGLDPRLPGCLELYKGTGIRVLLLSNFYCHVPEGAATVDASGRRIPMACLRSPEFSAWMRKTIVGLVEVFGRFEAFGGFCYDDAAGNRVDCCYCPRCLKEFREQTGKTPPRFEPAAGTGRVEPDDVRLLWDAFQREGYDRYIRLQAEATRSVSRGCLMVTIPADSYYYGHHMNCEVRQPDTPTGLQARLQRMTRFEVNPRYLFQAFPFPRLPEADEGFRPWAVGCHISRASTEVVEFTEGPVRIIDGQEREFASANEIRRLARFTVAEGASGISYWGWPDALSVYAEAFDAIADVHRDVDRLRRVLAERRPYPCSVGVLYSTTTEVLEQPWRVNTLERWQHLHAWESVLYTLRRAHIPHRVVVESEMSDATLAQLSVLVLAGVQYLTSPAANLLEERIRRGQLKVFEDPKSIPLKGATVVNFQPYLWYQRQLGGYRQPTYLEEQRRRIRSILVPRMARCTRSNPLVESEDVVSFPYLDSEGNLVLFLVNWDLYYSRSVKLPGVPIKRVTDLLPPLAAIAACAGGGVRLSVPPAGWRVVSVKPKR